MQLASLAHSPHETLYNRFVRWSKAGVFDHLFAVLASESIKTGTVMIDTTHLRAPRTAASLVKKGLFRAVSGTPESGLTLKLHAVCHGDGRPLILLLIEGQLSDYRGA